MSDSTVPRHLGIIMDGNRRWAKAHKLASVRGHAKGQKVLRDVALAAFESGVKYLSVYAFSTENWQRSDTEVSFLMRYVGQSLRQYAGEFQEIGVRIIFLGSREPLDVSIRKEIEKAEAATATNTQATLAICFNYGGQQEIVDATRAIIAASIPAQDITSELLANYLYSPDIPPIDLIIRTSGEQRLSNFMLWRAAYSELMFTDTLWPDFAPAELKTLLEQYARRQRRFGK